MAAVKTHLLAEEARGNSDANARTIPNRQCASRKWIPSHLAKVESLFPSRASKNLLMSATFRRLLGVIFQ
jgi:hypothetical protein